VWGQRRQGVAAIHLCTETNQTKQGDPWNPVQKLTDCERLRFSEEMQREKGVMGLFHLCLMHCNPPHSLPAAVAPEQACRLPASFVSSDGN